MRLHRFLLHVAASLAALCATHANAQALPDSVRIIVPFPAGGTQDIVARELARELAAKLSRPVVVESRVGAGGNIGTEAAARANPDGSVLVLASSGSLANNRLLYRSMPYDPEKDLAPIAYVGETPMFILGRASLPYARLSDLLADAGQGQPPLNFGSAGNGTISHLTLELLRENSKRAINHIPYKGGAPVQSDTLSGVIDGGVDLYTGGAVAQAASGKLRILAVTSSERMPVAPNVPSVVEEGFPQLRSSTWFALVGPRGMPQDYVARMNREVNAFITSSAGAARLQGLGVRTQVGPPELVTQRMREEIAKWTPIVRSRNIVLE